MRSRQLRHAAGVDDLSNRSGRGLEKRGGGTDRDFLGGSADFQRELQRQSIANANFDTLTHELLEA